jgi:7-cyano-7-deazaguanine synthase
VAGHLVILSGGLDSTVCLALAAEEEHPSEPLVAVTFDYGPRHRIELERAAAVVAHYGADHLVVRLDASQWGGSALTDGAIDVPDAGGPAGGGGGAIPVTYVPARNLIFLSIAMGIAEARDLDAVSLGVNALDYSGYPDCRPEFVESFAATAALALKRGVEGRPIEIRTPLLDKTKADIVRLGIAVRAPLELTWSCYRGDAEPCGTCDACALRARGFAEAGQPDPALPGAAR